jgi:outer membrane lipoprotein LolB
VPVRPAPPPASATALAAVDHWQASGRIAVRTAQDGFSAHFDWRQAGARAELGVRGPFGAGAAHLSVGPESIRVESGNEPPLEVPAPFEALEPQLVARLGFPLPLESLRYWILGVPAPSPVAIGAAPAFDQAGWHVVASQFEAVEQAPGSLPVRLELTRGATRIRVIVDRWQVGVP